jgi:hypothetical protein
MTLALVVSIFCFTTLIALAAFSSSRNFQPQPIRVKREEA